jgi:hypothetical protein
MVGGKSWVVWWWWESEGSEGSTANAERTGESNWRAPFK